MKSTLTALALTVACSAALAQTPAPAKPAAKPAAPAAKPAAPADNKTMSFAAGSGKGPIMTRDELRVCLQQEEAIRNRLTEHEGRRAPLDAEKAQIAADQNTLRAERAPLDAAKKEAEELAVRMKAHGERVSAWNLQVTDFNAAEQRGTQAERKRVELNKEREEIEKNQKAIEAERTRILAGGDVAVKAYNAKAAALDARVNDWNQRNLLWNDASKALEIERQGWVTNCADRRYREDDEIAIKKGK